MYVPLFILVPEPMLMNLIQGAEYQVPTTQEELLNGQTGPIVYSARAEKEFPVNMKSTMHVFSSHPDFRWGSVHHYRKPGHVYNDQMKFRHRDFADRVKNKPQSDRYLHHEHGYLRDLIVQTTDDIFLANSNATWMRTYIRKQAPIRTRMATWVIDFSYDPESWEDWWIMILRALPAAIGMTFIFWEVSITGQERFNGRYAPVPYKFHGHAKAWSNHLENRLHDVPLAPRRPNEYHILKPRHLCFLRNPKESELRGLDIREVSAWEADEGPNENLSYLFVAYSADHFNHGSEEDMQALHSIAEFACRQARLPAYWVYRISDILRGAQDLIIAVGNSSTRASLGKKPDTEALLRHWGTRMWTFPEVLLSPGKHITVYTRDGNLNSPLVLSKNQFAGRVWADTDAETSRQLIDHYIGSLDLSRLELAVLLLRCLYGRQTTQHLRGDRAYALMGLLRMRPEIDRTDSEFQAFARLSLANDSDQLLERSLCTLPLSPGQPWYDMTDAYQSALWDIAPTCQIAAICDNNTVIVDGAYGASIRWKSFYRIRFQRNMSFKRWVSAFLMEYNGYNLIIASTLLGIGSGPPINSAAVGVGVIFLLIFLYFWFMTPKLVRVLLGGKFINVQATLFGLEGHLNAATIERTLFGGAFGRMTWSVNGSPLSRSRLNQYGEREGIDPAKDPEVRHKIEAAKHAQPGQMRIFTLVDTYNMELTLFEAARPPTCIFVCAAEGGMRRAVACSYDWVTQTMCRETVLRIPTRSLNRMDRVPRFRMGTRWPAANDERPDLATRPFYGGGGGGTV
ncbi:hypothetical protein BKA67DRAFT_663235 [Truncatella angustata]|uniref:Uncharacterized protein n=1 Tax=Truncatella angustata TaxID=152316 RepID=A0A9P8UCZ1_9PEZI|nr:uncharacterized protein BKA67DRAFT_663235 [Truncatella angustata]KAH6646865.1 hypothetical protein BKA67DRAFT_663235 [Truncatella angustata]